MHIFVRITVHILMGSFHAHFCTNEYLYSYGFSLCTSLYKWLSIFLWVFVMHIFLRITIHIIMGFCHAHLFINDYFVPNLFPIRVCKTGILLCFLASFTRLNIWGRSPWCLSIHGEFLGVFSSNVYVSLSTQRSPTCE